MPWVVVIASVRLQLTETLAIANTNSARPPARDHQRPWKPLDRTKDPFPTTETRVRLPGAWRDRLQTWRLALVLDQSACEVVDDSRIVSQVGELGAAQKLLFTRPQRLDDPLTHFWHRAIALSRQLVGHHQDHRLSAVSIDYGDGTWRLVQNRVPQARWRLLQTRHRY